MAEHAEEDCLIREDAGIEQRIHQLGACLGSCVERLRESCRVLAATGMSGMQEQLLDRPGGRRLAYLWKAGNHLAVVAGIGIGRFSRGGCTSRVVGIGRGRSGKSSAASAPISVRLFSCVLASNASSALSTTTGWMKINSSLRDLSLFVV